MTRSRRTAHSRHAVLVLALGLLACEVADRITAPIAGERPLALFDALHSNGMPGVYFLPPMVADPAPAFSGTFDGTLPVVVEVRRLNGNTLGTLVASFSTSQEGSSGVRVDLAAEHYHVNWKADVDPVPHYRIRVLVGGNQLAFADVDVVTRGPQRRNTNASEFVSVVRGSTLPIKFRIEQGTVFVVGSEGGTFSAAGGDVTFEVAAGMVAGNQILGLTATPVQSFPAGPVLPGTVFDLGPEDVVFSPPIKVTVRYDPNQLAGVREDLLRLYKMVNGAWVVVPGSRPNPEDNTVTAELSGFSHYGAGAAAVTTTSLSTDAALALIGAPLVLTATISPAPLPAENPIVEFLDGATSLGTATPNVNGVATLTVSTLTFTVHALKAKFLGTTGFVASSSPSLTQHMIRKFDDLASFTTALGSAARQTEDFESMVPGTAISSILGGVLGVTSTFSRLEVFPSFGTRSLFGFDVPASTRFAGNGQYGLEVNAVRNALAFDIAFQQPGTSPAAVTIGTGATAQRTFLESNPATEDTPNFFGVIATAPIQFGTIKEGLELPSIVNEEIGLDNFIIANVALPATPSPSTVFITAPTTLNVPLGGTVSLPIQLSAVPTSNVSVTINSSNPAHVGIATSTVTIPAGSNPPVANLTLQGTNLGSATIHATSPGYIPSETQATTTAQLNILQSSVGFSDGFPTKITIRFQSAGNVAAAPAGGVAVTLTQSVAGCVAFNPASPTIAAGGTEVDVTLSYGGTATLPCTTMVTASATDLSSDQVSVNVQPKPPIFAGGDVTVGSGLQTERDGQLGTSNHGGRWVTVQSSDSAVLVTNDYATAGSLSTTIWVEHNEKHFRYWVQGKDTTTGTSTITASATGFSNGTIIATVVKPALRLMGPSPTTTSFSDNTWFLVEIGIPHSDNSTLQRRQEVRAGGVARTVTVKNSNPAVAQLVTTALTAQEVTVGVAVLASNSAGLEFDPKAAGTTQVCATIPDFTATAAACASVSISQPAIFAGSDLTVGTGLQRAAVGQLGAPNHGGVTVTLQSVNPALLLLAKDSATAGTPSIMIPVAHNSQSFTYWVQAKEGVTGADTITASAPGFNSDTLRATVVQPALEVVGLNTTPTSLSPNQVFIVRVGLSYSGNPSLVEYQQIRAGGVAQTVTVTNTIGAVAQLVTTALTHPQQVQVDIATSSHRSPLTVADGGVAFDPLGAGTTKVCAAIAGFIATTNACHDVSVSAPAIFTSGNVTVGSGLQISRSAALGASTHGGRNVTVQSSNPAVLIAPNRTTPGTPSITIWVGNDTASFAYWVQGKEGTTGTATITVSALGFTDGTITGTVVKPALQLSGVHDTPTSLSPSHAFRVDVGIPSSGNAWVEPQEIRAGGVARTATVTNLDPSVAQLITTAHTGQSVSVEIAVLSKYSPDKVVDGGVAFDPLGAGTTKVCATMGPDFTATTTACANVTISTPSIFPGSDVIVGSGLQRPHNSFPSLGASDHGGTLVRVESLNPAVLLVAPNDSTAGSQFIEIFVDQNKVSFNYWVQGVENVIAGSSAIKITAPGFTDATVSGSVVQPALQLAGLPATMNTLSADDEFVVWIGLPASGNSSLGELQDIRAGGVAQTATVTNTNGAVAQLVTTGLTHPTQVTVGVAVRRRQSPGTVAGGGVAFDPLVAGTTQVCAMIPGFVATLARCVNVTVQ